MQVYHVTPETNCLALRKADDRAQVMAIGDFDGIHSGHQEVLGRAVQTARSLGLTPSVMTFHPHPREILGLSRYKESLTPLKDKLKQFSALGLEQVYLISFNEEFAKLSPGFFVESMLVPLQIQTLVVGFDFTFGHQGAGNADTLGTLAAGRFAVEVVRPYHMYGEKVSSTLIRECLLNGQVEKANRLLNRDYSISGQVVTGEGRGRTIGVPTANVEPSDAYVVPGRGVYAVLLQVKDQWVKGVMNIGWKPTFAKEEGQDTLEVHLFDFNRFIYGEEVVIRFIGFIRHERKFGSADELVEQIHADMQRAKEILA
ncbi:MAG: bifunctional riboflavin kinase/FAD synthetase [Paenibacillaceae bacterium]|jgi:riboflavin kinase/FMN adenylyltransferase|nr:bifunctional riboflavin kinase/FAD synthetase [Paenibacillaceae bacterium]